MAISRILEPARHATPNTVLLAGYITVGAVGAVTATEFKGATFTRTDVGAYTFGVGGAERFIGMCASTDDIDVIINVTDNGDGTLGIQAVDSVAGTAVELGNGNRLYLYAFVKTDGSPIRGSKNQASELKANDNGLIVFSGRFTADGGAIGGVNAAGCTVAYTGSGDYLVTLPGLGGTRILYAGAIGESVQGFSALTSDANRTVQITTNVGDDPEAVFFLIIVKNNSTRS